MASVRRMNIGAIRYRIETIDRIPNGMYGSAIAAVVFVPVVDYGKVRVAA